MSAPAAPGPAVTDRPAPRIAITGAGGLMGRALQAALAKAGFTFRIIEGDILEAETFPDSGFDRLVHLAGVLPHRFRTDPIQARRINVEGTRNALIACQRAGAGLILASSAGVYAAGLEGAIGEQAPIDPPAPYGESKAAAEALCRQWGEDFGLPTRMLRFFNVYGPGQGPELLPGYILDQARRGEPIVLRNPDSRRDFIHVADAAGALVAVATREGPPHALGEVFNIGSGSGIRVGDLAQAVVDRLPRPVEIRVTGGGDDAVTCSFADIRRAREALGWRPELNLAAGVAHCLGRDKAGDWKGGEGLSG